MTSTLALLCILGTQDAHAINPETSVHIGMEPQRIFRAHPQVQARLEQQPDYQRFLADAPGWQGRFDEVTRAPWRMWGGGISMPTGSEGELAEALIGFLDRHAALLRFAPGTLEVANASYVERLDTWYVDLTAPIDGVPIWRGGITARVKHGNLVLLGALTYGERPVEGTWSLTGEEAINAAIAAGPVPDITHDERSAEKIWLPVEDLGGLRLVATWAVRSRTHAVPGKWVSFVHADSGELLNVHNEVRFIDGVVTGWHAERTLDGSPLVQSPLPEAVISNGYDIATSALDGAFTIPAGADYFTDLDGSYVDVHNGDGPDAEMIRLDGELDWTTADATQAEISSYVFLHQVRAWGERVAPDVDMVQGPIDSYVNLRSGACNAYFDGDVNFYAADQGCANTGQIGDVAYHEWGHGFHLYSVESQWFGFDGSLSEGAADVVAFLQTKDNIIAPHFFDDGGGIRDVAPNRSYPDDYETSDYAVHTNGLIFGGAMWDLWHLLMAIEGEQEGTESTERIFAGLLRGGPDVAGSYEEALLGDDDDGNLANGTPHECEIIEAFGEHGLGPLGGGSGIYVAAHHPEKVHATADLPYPINVEVRSSAPNCFEVAPETATVRFKVDNGEWQSAELGVGATDIAGEIPAQEEGSYVQYFIQVNDASGSDFTLPAGSDINPFGFYVGPVIEVYCTDFEKGRAGFKHELVDGEEAEGADDWQWGTPAGNGGDPTAAYSGDKVWGNDLGWDNFNGEYQNGKHNRLSSPEIDNKHYLGSFLSFQRWLTVEDGVWDQAQVRADGTILWTNTEGVQDSGGRDHLDADWAPMALPLKGEGKDGAVVIDWSLISDEGLSFGGWTLDDVCIFAPDTADNRLGISGIEAARNDEGVALSWTNPLHAPVTSVFVIRNDHRMPTSFSDGVLIWTNSDVEVGATDGFLDVDAPKHDVYYGVYGADDTDALSWTREGFNGAFAEGDGPAPAKGSGAIACGCDTAGPSGGLAGLVVMLGLIGIRRREQR